MKMSTKYHCISDTHFGHDMLVKNGLRTSGYEQDILIDRAYDFNIHGHTHDGRECTQHPQRILVTDKIVNLKKLVGK